MSERIPAAVFEVNASSDGGTCLLRAHGELDIASAPALERAIDEALASTAEAIVVDLGGVTFIDSTGLRVLLGVSERCEGGRLSIWSVRALDRVAEIAGVRDRLPIADRPPGD